MQLYWLDIAPTFNMDWVSSLPTDMETDTWFQIILFYLLTLLGFWFVLLSVFVTACCVELAMGILGGEPGLALLDGTPGCLARSSKLKHNKCNNWYIISRQWPKNIPRWSLNSEEFEDGSPVSHSLATLERRFCYLRGSKCIDDVV